MHLIYLVLKFQFVPRRRYCVSVMNTSFVIISNTIIVICSVRHMGYINSLFFHSQGFLTLNQFVLINYTVNSRVNVFASALMCIFRDSFLSMTLKI